MIENMSKWGRAKARERYGNLRSPSLGVEEDQNKPQRLGDKNNLQGPDYDNDHPNDWVRGKGESAEGKPGFDK